MYKAHKKQTVTRRLTGLLCYVKTCAVEAPWDGWTVYRRQSATCSRLELSSALLQWRAAQTLYSHLQRFIVNRSVTSVCSAVQQNSNTPLHSCMVLQWRRHVFLRVHCIGCNSSWYTANDEKRSVR